MSNYIPIERFSVLFDKTSRILMVTVKYWNVAIIIYWDKSLSHLPYFFLKIFLKNFFLNFGKEKLDIGTW